MVKSSIAPAAGAPPAVVVEDLRLLVQRVGGRRCSRLHSGFARTRPTCCQRFPSAQGEVGLGYWATRFRQDALAAGGGHDRRGPGGVELWLGREVFHPGRSCAVSSGLSSRRGQTYSALAPWRRNLTLPGALIVPGAALPTAWARTVRSRGTVGRMVVGGASSAESNTWGHCTGSGVLYACHIRLMRRLGTCRRD